MVKLSLEPVLSDDARRLARMKRFSADDATMQTASGSIGEQFATHPRSDAIPKATKSRSRSPRRSILRKDVGASSLQDGLRAGQGFGMRSRSASPPSARTPLPSSGRRGARAVPLLHSVHKGTVVSKRCFGVFVRLGDGETYGDGLLHNSKISADITYREGEAMTTTFFFKSLEVGDIIYAKVIEHRGRDKYNLDMRFVSQADGTDNDPDDLHENNVYKTVRHVAHPRQRFDDHTHHVPDATQEPADRTIETFRSGHELTRTTSMQCSLGLRNCNNLLLRCSQAPLQRFDAVVARWFAAPATDASVTANNLKSLMWSYLRNPKSLWMAMGTKIVACSLQTGTTTLIFDTATAETSGMELRALVKGPALATVMFPGVCCHSNRSENLWFRRFCAPRNLMWSVYKKGDYSAPKVVAQRVSKSNILQKTGS
mmetsp:Transcript_95160/g.204278  ORF Transcript_95160/g.204278 Transcript_95160/m.204278 type:complete len:428 (+) Transcript_95160:35-1318(+)